MFTSLRSRLLLTYVLVIGVVLCVAGTALIVYILQNPAIDRLLYVRLDQAAENVLQQEMPALSSQQTLHAIAQRIDQQYDVRVLVLSVDGEVLTDSRIESEPELAPKTRRITQGTHGLAWDANRRAWLFVWQPLDDDTFLVLAVPRVRKVSLLFSQRLREILRDDLFPPLLQAGCAALIIALILALWMSRWVAAPLQHMAAAARDVSAGEYGHISVEGPEEVQSLAHAFNEMTARVQASQQSQRDFVSNVSHELKTPLTSIQGFSQAMLDGTADTPEKLQQSAEVIFSEAGRMHRMVLDLLDLARLDAGTVELERVSVDLTALLHNVTTRLSPQAAQAQVDLQFESFALPIVIGDGDRLTQVFTNLVENALKYTPPGGQVRLRAVPAADCVEISVEDTGPGIPPEDLKRIFERFYQVDKSRPGGGRRGIGLGLPIAREIVHAHGGTITVHSQTGQGSVFVVKIPLARPDDSTLTTRRKD